METNVIKVTARCPIRTTLELVGGKWKLLIMYQLIEKPLRLSELKKRIPDISEKMLVQELKNLIDSNLVERNDLGETPPRIEYQLNELGKKAMPLIAEMKQFAVMYENENK